MILTWMFSKRIQLTDAYHIISYQHGSHLVVGEIEDAEMLEAFDARELLNLVVREPELLECVGLKRESERRRVGARYQTRSGR